jgi:transposase
VARYKSYSYAQGKFIPIHFEKQIIPGTFEYSLNHLIDHKLDLLIFDKRYRNEETGATAYDPKILLKIILYAYSRGIVSSRRIAQACEENIIFMALSCDTKPHFTTIADFVSTMDKEITGLFREVLLVCDDMGLIGKEMFAIDGCKLPSNASKEWSGTKADFEKKGIQDGESHRKHPEEASGRRSKQDGVESQGKRREVCRNLNNQSIEDP